MAGRKYRGMEIAPEHVDMAKNLDIVDELIDELRDLQSTWNNLSLLGELANVGAEITGTRTHFQQLAGDLTNFLIEQSSRQAVELLATRAQNSIDILVRNLYERTADIGFLATDPVLAQACIAARKGESSPDLLKQVTSRMEQYVDKYSVYKNVILLDEHARVLADIQGQLESGQAMGWVRDAVQKSRNYAEAFRPLTTTGNQPAAELVYAWKVCDGNQSIGYVVLVFNLEEESHALFSRVLGKQQQAGKPEWKLCGVLRESGEVLISSNPRYIGKEQAIQLPEGKSWGIVQLGPVAYLACVRPTRGYQGYSGPGWKGFCLVPLMHAFIQETNGSEQDIPPLNVAESLIDKRITGFKTQAAEIQKQLNRSIWNGNMTQKNGTSTLGSNFSKTLLWEISRAGESTKNLFTQSLQNLVQAEITGFQAEQQARAMLAIDLMDRNLYERANDCRWWALNPRLQNALLKPGDPEVVQDSMKCLQHIHSLYTVYSNILLLDNQGRVLADSMQQLQSGALVDEAWVKNAMLLNRPTEYCVSNFESTPLYQDRPTYIYAAAVFENPHKPAAAIGAIALVFDSEPQLEAILNESMGDSSHKAFAFFLDEKHRVVSSTTNQYSSLGMMSLELPKSGKFEKQAVTSGYVEFNNRLIAYGTCNSGSYREYKSATDRYQNNLICLFGLELGPILQADRQQAGSISFDEFRQMEQREQLVDIASFRINRHWYGIDSEDAVEAFVCRQIMPMPNSMPWVLGSTLYRNEAITVIDISRILEPGHRSRRITETNPQMILLKTRPHAPMIALLVDELGEIPGLPLSAIHESDTLHAQGGMVQGLVKTHDNLLVVLNVEQLLLQLEQGVKKAPDFRQGLFSEAFGR